jgi:hypothetical protein
VALITKSPLYVYFNFRIVRKVDKLKKASYSRQRIIITSRNCAVGRRTYDVGITVRKHSIVITFRSSVCVEYVANKFVEECY